MPTRAPDVPSVFRTRQVAPSNDQPATFVSEMFTSPDDEVTAKG